MAREPSSSRSPDEANFPRTGPPNRSGRDRYPPGERGRHDARAVAGVDVEALDIGDRSFDRLVIGVDIDVDIDALVAMATNLPQKARDWFSRHDLT